MLNAQHLPVHVLKKRASWYPEWAKEYKTLWGIMPPENYPDFTAAPSRSTCSPYRTPDSVENHARIHDGY